MSYEINDVNGTLAHGPSTTGLREMKLLLASAGEESYPATTHFFVHGYTSKLIALSAECTNLAKKTTDKNIQHSLKHIARYAKNADDTIYLHNGVS